MTESKENTHTRRKKFWKFWLLMAIVNLGLLFVVVRLFQIQIIEGDKYKERAKRQHESKITLGSQRGNIYDRNGRLLASTVKSYSLAADPTVLENKNKVLSLLEQKLGISKSTLDDKIKSAKGSFVWLVRGISPDKMLELNDISDKGLIKIKEPKRHYYYGSDASQVIGCTNIDNRGLTGVELGWDSMLTGRSGYMMMYRDAKGRLRPSADLPIIPATNGYSLQLTMDIELQRIVEFELMQGVLNAQAESGTVVAVKPSTGEILAMATYPGFNPNSPSSFSPANMRNRAITDVYEPGSTFKLITAAAAIEEKIASLNDKFNGFNGELHFSNYVIRDVHPIGMATFREGMIHSSNIILSSVAAKIPDYKFYKYIRDFGFGISSGIDLPGEVSGRTQRAEQMNISAKRFIGFGYGILSTPLQIASAYSAIANNGVMMKPFAIKAIYDEKGGLVREFKPEKIRRVVSENTAQLLNGVLTDVINKGTGSGAKVDGLAIAGKTGTSQQLVGGAYSKADYNASFVGYFPAENPQVCILVFLDKPKTSIYGGSTAAPIFKNIALRWVSLPSQSYTLNSKPTAANSDTIYVPNLNGLLLEDAGNILNSLGVRWSSNSQSGIVESVFPRPGEKILRSTAIRIQSTGDSLKANPSKLPSVVGLSVRRALAILHSSGVKAKVKGSGKVIRQIWEQGENKEQICTLICSPD